jgi:squalene-hopene/tetraprenyl-beta-curcumene cyclase
MKQLATGGWSVYEGEPASLDPSVKAYLALKLAGLDRSAPTMMRAAAIIRKLGGLERTRSYTRFYLALLGQIPWESLPPIPVELLLAPNWSPINLYSVSAWTRAMLVPMAIIRHFKPTRMISVERGISELFAKPNRKGAVSADRWRVDRSRVAAAVSASRAYSFAPGWPCHGREMVD